MTDCKNSFGNARLRFHAVLCTCLAVSATAGGTAHPSDPPKGVPVGYRLVYSQDFETPAALRDFEFSYPPGWRLTTRDKNTALECFGKHRYRPKVRSPFIIGLLSGWQFGDFVLEADLRQTGRDYGHRDMCLFFGFRDTARFYYCHLATRADPHAHNIFVVNDSPRTRIADHTTAGIDWGRNAWRHVRLVRRLSDGLIAVYFEDMTTPVMTARDRTHGMGAIGFGSFDDSGMIDNIRVYAPAAAETKTRFFRSVSVKE